MGSFTPSFYEVPTQNDTQDLLTIFQFVNNDATGGLFFPIMIMVIWAVQFISILSEGRRASNAWIYASFTAFILSVMLGILALMSITIHIPNRDNVILRNLFYKMTKTRE